MLIRVAAWASQIKSKREKIVLQYLFCNDLFPKVSKNKNPGRRGLTEATPDRLSHLTDAQPLSHKSKETQWTEPCR